MAPDEQTVDPRANLAEDGSYDTSIEVDPNARVKAYAVSCRNCGKATSFDASEADGLIRCSHCGIANLAPIEAIAAAGDSAGATVEEQG